MRAIYGDDGGFGWKLNEVVGTQMVVVPYTLPAELAAQNLPQFSGVYGGNFPDYFFWSSISLSASWC